MFTKHTHDALSANPGSATVLPTQTMPGDIIKASAVGFVVGLTAVSLMVAAVQGAAHTPALISLVLMPLVIDPDVRSWPAYLILLCVGQRRWAGLADMALWGAGAGFISSLAVALILHLLTIVPTLCLVALAASTGVNMYRQLA